MVLPIIRPNLMRRAIPKDHIDRIQGQLISALSQPSAIEASDALPFLSSYVGDIAKVTLESDPNSEFKPTETSDISDLPSSVALRDAAWDLLEHLAASSARRIPSSLLIDAMIVYSGPGYHLRIQAFGQTVLGTTPSLSQEILTALQGAIQSCFGPRISPLDTLNALHRAIHALTLVLHTGIAPILDEFTSPNNAPGVRMLVQIHEQLLPSVATTLSQSTRPMAQSLVRGDADWAIKWLHIKISLLDIFQVAFSFVTPTNPGSENAQRLTMFASALTSSVVPQATKTSKQTLLVDSPLLADYERLFQFSGTLRTKGWTDGGPTAAFASLAEHLEIDRAVVRLLIGSDVELERTPITHTVALPVVADVKGKGKAVHEEPDPAIEQGVSTILGILPDQDPILLRRCLAHPNYRGEGGVERLMAALFEGTLPIELNVSEEDEPAHLDAMNPSKEDDLEEIIGGRANVLDAMKMDMSSLRMGKKQNTADELLNDSSRQEMKAAILRLAQEAANEEEEEAAASGIGRRKLVPFDEDDFDDDFGNVSVVGDGETSDGEDDEAEEKVPVETTLERAYLDNPSLFDRDAATRRSQGRKALKSQTGWSDEQIEGWKIMLERNPKKDQILAKHEFRGNKAIFATGVEPRGGGDGGNRGGRGSQGKGRGRGGGRGDTAEGAPKEDGASGSNATRGHGGRGGRGNQEGSNTARDRAFKEKNKSRARQGGHDRKVARGGGGPA